MRVKILGAGSVGNHLAFSCRKHDLDVTVMDIDEAALARMQEETYPSRYGFWDSAIKITHSDNDDALWDLIIIATPPDSHLELANKIIQKNNTEALLIEKPLGPPKLEDILRFRTNCSNSAMKIFIGYNHVLTPHSVQFENVARELTFANPLQLNVFFKEHWQGIFDAHPWLSGPEASYLGRFSRGGGASCEHSHGINAFQHFSSVLGLGRIHQVSSEMSFVESSGVHYDQLVQLNVLTEKRLIGHIQQDVITYPPVKTAFCQFSNGHIRWTVNHRTGSDSIEYFKDEEHQLIEIEKTRPDDFHPEIKHIVDIIEGRGNYAESPIHIQNGIDTMLVICAAFLSHNKGRKVMIDYNADSPDRILALHE